MKRYLPILVLFFALPARASFPYIPVVQSWQGVITNACTPSINVTSGNLLIVASVWKTGNTSPTVSDTRSSTWTQAFLDLAPAVKVGIYTTTLASSGAETITFNETSATAQNVECVELKPVWTMTVDAATDNVWSGTPNPVTTPSVTTTLNDDLVFSIISGNGNGGTYSIVPPDQTLGLDVDSSTAYGIKLAGAPGSYSMAYTATTNTASGTAATVAFKSLSGITMQSPTTLPDGSISNPYNYCLQATGGTGGYTWSINGGNLQSGLSLNTSTGCITGTPIFGPQNTVSFHVTDGTNTANLAGATLKVSSAANTPTVAQVVQALPASNGHVTFASNVTSGNLLIVSRTDNFGVFPNGNIGVCSDSLGTPFQPLISNHPDVGQQFDSLVYAGIAPSTGMDTIDCHVSSNSDVWSAEEISNVGYFGNDNTVMTQGSSASPISATLTTLVPKEFVYANAVAYTSTATLAIQSPFTAFTTNADPNEGYQVVTSVAGYSPSFTMSGNTDGHWSVLVIGFRPTGGAAAPPPPPPASPGTSIQ